MTESMTCGPITTHWFKKLLRFEYFEYFKYLTEMKDKCFFRLRCTFLLWIVVFHSSVLSQTMIETFFNF